jgi:hypothetical protein
MFGKSTLQELNKSRRELYPFVIALIVAIPVIFRGEILEKGHANNSLSITQCYELTLYSGPIAASNLLLEFSSTSNTSCAQTSYDALVAKTPFLPENGFMPGLLNVLQMTSFTLLALLFCIWKGILSMIDMALGCHVQNIIAIHLAYAPAYAEAILWICPLYILFHITVFHFAWKLWEDVKAL